MKELHIISLYVTKMSQSIWHLFSTPLGISVTIPIVSASVASSETEGIYFLGILLFSDFVTGIGASYFEKKEAEKTNPELKKQSLISSEKAKLSVVKIVLYFLAFICANKVDKIFLVKPIDLFIFHKPLSISLIVIGVCCAIEFYSIFFENFKRMGIDILGILKKMVITTKEIKELI